MGQCLLHARQPIHRNRSLNLLSSSWTRPLSRMIRCSSLSLSLLGMSNSSIDSVLRTLLLTSEIISISSEVKIFSFFEESSFLGDLKRPKRPMFSFLYVIYIIFPSNLGSTIRIIAIFEGIIKAFASLSSCLVIKPDEIRSSRMILYVFLSCLRCGGKLRKE